MDTSKKNIALFALCFVVAAFVGYLALGNTRLPSKDSQQQTNKPSEMTMPAFVDRSVANSEQMKETGVNGRSVTDANPHEAKLTPQATPKSTIMIPKTGENEAKKSEGLASREFRCPDYVFSITAIRIGTVEIRHVGYTDREAAQFAAEKFAIEELSRRQRLVICVKLHNQSARKKLYYKSTEYFTFNMKKELVEKLTLEDDVGNVIVCQNRGLHEMKDKFMSLPSVDPLGKEVLPGESLSDTFVFELPLPNTEHLVLRIRPAIVFGPGLFDPEKRFIFPMIKTAK